MFKMQRITYTEELWSGTEVDPRLQLLLEGPDCLIEIAYGTSPYAVVIGVPHQAASGTPDSALKSLREADECAALPALVTFSALKRRAIPCKLVIAARATDHDPNKTAESPYWASLFSEIPAQILLEIHGAGENRRHELELTSGKNERGDPLCLGTLLNYALGRRHALAVQIHPGNGQALIITPDGMVTPGRLELPALNTPSLIEAGHHGIAAFHLEARPHFRRTLQGDNRLTPTGRQLGLALAHALSAYLKIIATEPPATIPTEPSMPA